MLTADYRRLVGELATAAHRRDADLAAAEQSYLDGIAELRSEFVLATAAVEQATGRVATAMSTVEDVDREAARLWSALHGRRVGELPAPAASTVDDLRALLASAADHIARASAPTVPLPRRAMPLLPALGAASAATVGLIAGGLVMPGNALFVGLGWLAFLLAPFAGLPVARLLARRWWGAALDTGAVGLIVLGGMVACTVLVVALR